MSAPIVAVYPRSRGEQAWLITVCGKSTGLSPLARGTAPWCAAFVGAMRFIPARAGNSERTVRELRGEAVYPRSRGEQIVDNVTVETGSGLSPLARGTGYNYLPEKRAGRFIPARAGNSTSGRWAPGRQTVYPRSRGEQMGGHCR